jgi:hypothetical protein
MTATEPFQDTDTSRNAPLDVGMPTASSANAPLSTALANTIAAPGPVPVDNVAQYLRDRFASRLDRIVHVQNLACGTGYRHCTQEKHVTSICTSLGLQLVSRVYAPIHVEGGLAITYDDVVRAAGLNASTFAAARGHVRRARQACMRLARYVSANEGEADENWMRWYRVFDALLGESDIGDEHLSDSTGSARAEAISLGYEELKRKTVDILQNLP